MSEMANREHRAGVRVEHEMPLRWYAVPDPGAQASAHDGTTVFLSSHILSEVEQVCDRVAILRAGRIVAEGDTQAMLRTGERLLVRFDTPAEADQARPILATIGEVTEAAGGALYLEADPGQGSRVARALASGGLYPAELSVHRPSLESVFLELMEPAAA